MKRILILLCLLFFQAQGAQNLYVKSLQEYNSVLPNQKFRVEVLEDVFIGNIPIVRGDILNCSLKQIKSPKRAKRDARIYFEIISYEDIKGVHKFQDKIVAKYAKKVLKNKIKSVHNIITENNEKIYGKTVILTTGTYLKADILRGSTRTRSGPNGEKPSLHLSDKSNPNVVL